MPMLTTWSLLAAGALIGIAIGAAVALILVRRDRGDEPNVESLKRDLAEYRSDVAAHYAETAKRVDALTHAYKDVYEHLEDGAYRLVGESELRRRLDDARSEPVTLEGIGRKALDSAGGDRRDAGSGDAAPSESGPRSDDRTRPSGPAGDGPAPGAATSDASSAETPSTTGPTDRTEPGDEPGTPPRR